uniref:Reverse transcriptase zinc-binding domain-containing protein n=1 Tax=Triticum urartu TaxID=4572 RepID=A0A8R7TE14_TRIUA
KFFAWLVVKNRCWTLDRLAARSLPHQPCCPLCLQEPETLDHLLIQCFFARAVWFNALRARE